LKIRDSVVFSVSIAIQNGVIISIDFLEESIISKALLRGIVLAKGACPGPVQLISVYPILICRFPKAPSTGKQTERFFLFRVVVNDPCRFPSSPMTRP
jgi:hypothetical protein